MNVAVVDEEGRLLVEEGSVACEGRKKIERYRIFGEERKIIVWKKYGFNGFNGFIYVFIAV